MLPTPFGISMKTWTGMCAVLVLTALVVTGCLGGENPTVPDPGNPALFVDYQRSGGVAGVNDRLVIFDNGVGLVSSGTATREIVFNQSTLEGISAVFEAAQFSKLEGNFTSLRGGTDLLQYSIRYQNRSINTEETAIPPSLEPVVQEMDRIVSSTLNNRQPDLHLPARGS